MEAADHARALSAALRAGLEVVMNEYTQQVLAVMRSVLPYVDYISSVAMRMQFRYDLELDVMYVTYVYDLVVSLC